jgi:ABC-2 type transport system permease protein
VIGALRTARTLLSVHYAHMVEYRAELILWTLSGSLPLIMMGVWMQAGASGQFPLTPVAFARYFLAVFLVRQLTVVWVIWDFEREVVEGRLSPRLLQPLDPAWHHIARHVAERGARAPFVLALVALFFALYPEALWTPSPGDVARFFALAAAAFVLRFSIQYTFCMLAFWTERASSVQQLWYLFYLFLSGMIAPLSVFPPAVREVALWTPFPYLIDVPAGALVGRELALGSALGIMAAWTAGFLVLNRLLWRRGLRRYSAMGG